MRPEFSAALDGVRGRQAGRQALAQRGVRNNGLSVDTYNAVNPNSNHLKTDKGCFTKQSAMMGQHEAFGAGQRWWRTGCRETKSQALLNKPLETDALGRALGTGPGTGSR